MLKTSYNQLSSADQALIDLAKAMTSKAYAPYSGFCVGAALRLIDGMVFTGCNQENAAYGECLCAERVTLLYATANHPQTAPDTLAIAAWHNNAFTQQPISPCGACRQVLLEMEKRFNHNIRIVMYGANEVWISHNATELLPSNFSSNQLKD